MAKVNDLVGKTITKASLSAYDKCLTLVFSDGTILTAATPEKPYAVSLVIQLKEDYTSVRS